MSVYENASERYNEYLGVYYDQHLTLSNSKKRKLDNKYEPKNLFLDLIWVGSLGVRFEGGGGGVGLKLVRIMLGTGNLVR